MSLSTIKEKLHSFIDTANDSQLEKVYLFIENELAEKYNWWQDDDFIAELDRRVRDYESGKVKGISWEDVKLKARLLRQSTSDKEEKIDLMKRASSDPLFLADMREINADFNAIDSENI